MEHDKLKFMDKGTMARINGEFEDWPQEDVERYWAMVDEFNKEYGL